MKFLIAIAAFFFFGATGMAGAAGNASVRKGDVWLNDRRLTQSGKVTEAKLSPDGRLVAFIRRDRPGATELDPDYNTLWLVDSKGGKSRKLVSWRPSPRNPENELMGLASLHWSLDGRYLFFLSAGWATTDGIHQIDVTTGEERFVLDGVSLAVIQNGPYGGMLLVSRHTCHKEPGCDYPYSIARLDGSIAMAIPGTGGARGDEAVARWLKVHRWAAQ